MKISERLWNALSLGGLLAFSVVLFITTGQGPSL